MTYTYDALDNRIGMDENGTQTWTLYDGSTPVMDFSSSGSLTMRYLNGPAGSGGHGAGAPDVGRDGLVVPARPAGDDPRPDQQLGIDHRPCGLQRLRDGAGRVEPVEWRPDDGLRGDGARYGHRAEPGGASGREPGDGEVDEPGFSQFCGGDTNLYRYVANSPYDAGDDIGFRSPSSNWNFFWDWAFGTGDRIRVYGPDSPESREMRSGPGGGKLRKAFYAGGCKTRKFSYGTGEAAWDTLKPWYWGDTSFQVGGFVGIGINNGDGTVTFRVYNVAGTCSFFYHAVPDRNSYQGPMTNIYQYFEWTEPIDPNCCGPNLPPTRPTPKRTRPPAGTPMKREL